MGEIDTHIRRQVDISRIAVHAWSGLADTRVLVPDGDIVRRGRGLVVASLFRQVQVVAPLGPLLLRDSSSL